MLDFVETDTAFDGGNQEPGDRAAVDGVTDPAAARDIASALKEEFWLIVPWPKSCVSRRKLFNIICIMRN